MLFREAKNLVLTEINSLLRSRAKFHKVRRKILVFNAAYYLIHSSQTYHLLIELSYLGPVELQVVPSLLCVRTGLDPPLPLCLQALTVSRHCRGKLSILQPDRKSINFPK